MAMERKLKKVDKLFKDVVANIATHCEEFRYFYHTNEFKQRWIYQWDELWDEFKLNLMAHNVLGQWFGAQ